MTEATIIVTMKMKHATAIVGPIATLHELVTGEQQLCVVLSVRELPQEGSTCGSESTHTRVCVCVCVRVCVCVCVCVCVW